MQALAIDEVADWVVMNHHRNRLLWRGCFFTRHFFWRDVSAQMQDTFEQRQSKDMGRLTRHDLERRFTRGSAPAKRRIERGRTIGAPFSRRICGKPPDRFLLRVFSRHSSDEVWTREKLRFARI